MDWPDSSIGLPIPFKHASGRHIAEKSPCLVVESDKDHDWVGILTQSGIIGFGMGPIPGIWTLFGIPVLMRLSYYATR